MVLAAAMVAALAAVGIAAGPAAAAPQSSRVAALDAEIAGLDARLDAVVSRYGVTAQRLSEMRADVRANRSALRSAEYSLALTKATLADRVVEIYKERPVDMLDVIMGSGSFEEMLGKLTMMRRLSAADAQLVTSTESLQHQLLRRRESLAVSVTRLQASLASVGSERVRLEAMLSERRALVADLRKTAPPKAKKVAQPTTRPTPEPTVTVVGEGSWWPAIQAAAAANGVDAHGLYKLMLAESGGVATVCNGPYCGLFQYSVSSWHADWNPWRGASIFDGAAQIRASALAVELGLGPGLWPNTFGYAFSG
jgi:hypothetical protein